MPDTPIEPPSLDDVAKQPAANAGRRQRRAVAKPSQAAMIAVPLGCVPSGYIRRHINLQLSQERAEALASVLAELNASDERLADGKHVASAADAIRWLLDRIAEKNTNDTKR